VRTSLKIGVYFSVLLFLLVSTNYYNTENNLPQKANTKAGSTAFFTPQESGQINFIENKNCQRNIVSQQNIVFSKLKTHNLIVLSPMFNSWKTCKGYFYVFHSLSNIYSLEISDIIYPFHDFL
jgi:hypothetical protein